MGHIEIQEFTTKSPITMIGYEAGVCYGSNIQDNEKNYKRGIDCLKNEHGRTFEFPDVYMTISGYSARVIREWYTHIGGSPTRLQGSTRYIDYSKNFAYVTPPKIKRDEEADKLYSSAMEDIATAVRKLIEAGQPVEDASMLLPLGMETTIVDKRNLRNLMDMAKQRLCTRAYHEYREMFKDIMNALSAYSPEWKYLVDNYFVRKCEYRGYCTERKSCGYMPTKEEK